MATIDGELRDKVRSTECTFKIEVQWEHVTSGGEFSRSENMGCFTTSSDRIFAPFGDARLHICMTDNRYLSLCTPNEGDAKQHIRMAGNRVSLSLSVLKRGV